MRNLFNQYTHPENRLTHALVSSIANDQYLLRKFIKWTTGNTIAKKETIHVIEQSLPDQMEESEDEATRKGLPDACIYTENGWILFTATQGPKKQKSIYKIINKVKYKPAICKR